MKKNVSKKFIDRVEEALQTSKNLLYFWKKYNTTIANTGSLLDEDHGNLNGTESVKSNIKLQAGNSSKVYI